MRRRPAWQRAGRSTVTSRFQEHVLRLRAGGTIDVEVITALAPVLRGKLRARGLWRRPPSFLDYPELDDWRSEQDLEILVLDAVGYAIIDRLRALSARIDAGDNVDGFVLRNIDNFLGERQERADPVGASTYRWVSRVLAEHAGILRVEEGSTTPEGVRVLTEAELGELAGAHPRWSMLMRALGRGGPEANDEVRRFCDAIAATGPVAVETGDVVNVLRGPARRWQRAVQAHPGDSREDSALRHLQALGSRQMVARLEAAIERLDAQARVRGDLRRVLDGWREAFERGDDLSQAELAERLGMKKATVSDHVRRLRALILELDPDEPSGPPLSRERERR